MADKNFNQGHQSQQSNQDWDNERNRYNQDNEWSLQNRGSNQGYRDAGYSGSGNQQQDNRVNYLPDNDDNRYYGNTQYGSSGGYRSGNRGSYGNAGNNYGQSDWNRQRNDGNQYGHENDRNSRNWQQSGAGYGGSDYGRQDWNRSNMNAGYNQRDDGNRGYGSGYENTGYGGGYSNRGNDHDRGWHDDRNRGNRGDENWWDKTKDKVSSWFNDDDDKNRDRNREYGGGHRGKGPSNYRRSEDRIREDICDRLTDDDRVDASNISVQIQSDSVILSGTVNSRDEKRRAEDLVESISGVHNVENRLRVGRTNDLSSHDYTGNTDMTGGIGTESGTTNEIIRNANAESRGK